MKKRIIWGWSTCLTYETKKQLGFDHYSRLLDEMKENGMKRLIVMMGSQYHFDPNNHGIAWPVINPRLKSMLDRKAINANPSTEFFSKVIERAKKLEIEIYLEIKYAGFCGILKGYPNVDFKTNRYGVLDHETIKYNSERECRLASEAHVCHDSDQVQEYMKDTFEDVLRAYPKIDGIVMEHPSAYSCFCKSSQEKFRLAKGKSLFDATKGERIEWQNEGIRTVIADIIAFVKRINRDMKFAFYSGFSPEDGNIERYQELRGHKKETLQNTGVDLVMPYMEGRHKEKEEKNIEKVIEYMKPLDCYVHCTIRRNPPKTYPLPPKGPEYIERIIKWAINYHKKDNNFIGMSFFNEVNIPNENREAVYKAIKNQK